MDDIGTTKLLAFYTLFFLPPLALLLNRLWCIEKQSRRTADALEQIARRLDAKPLKLDDVIGSDQTL